MRLVVASLYEFRKMLLKEGSIMKQMPIKHTVGNVMVVSLLRAGAVILAMTLRRLMLRKDGVLIILKELNR